MLETETCKNYMWARKWADSCLKWADLVGQKWANMVKV